MDWFRQAPDTLRRLADMIEGGSMPGPPTSDDGDPSDLPPPGDWFKDFDRSAVNTAGAGTVASAWHSLLDKYRKSTFLDPIPQTIKKRYVWDREQGEIAALSAAEEYTDIAYAGISDFVFDDFDDRMTRKEFDIPFFKTEITEIDDKVPYTFFLCDISGSMSGIRAQHACAIAQVAAEKVFDKKGVFVWMPYGGRREAVREFRDITTFEPFLRGVKFDCGTTYIGRNLQTLSQGLNYGSPYDHTAGEYLIPKECSKKSSKVFVIHDGEDEVEDVNLQLPLFSILLANHHEMLERISKRTKGKYLLIKDPN